MYYEISYIYATLDTQLIEMKEKRFLELTIINVF